MIIWYLDNLLGGLLLGLLSSPTTKVSKTYDRELAQGLGALKFDTDFHNSKFVKKIHFMHPPRLKTVVMIKAKKKQLRLKKQKIVSRKERFLKFPLQTNWTDMHLVKSVNVKGVFYNSGKFMVCEISSSGENQFKIIEN